MAQLGHDYPYGPDGNDGPPVEALLEWGGRSETVGRVSAPEPLFPRLETEAS
jgi:hypothetical protein